MFTKTAITLALILGTASSALAVTKQHSVAPSQVYDARGRYLGSDPDAGVRFELRRDQNARDRD
jgi:hypothetical protein